MISPQPVELFIPKTKPYKHQSRTFEATRHKRFWALFAEQGLGKTKMTIDTADWLFSQGRIDRVFIVAPNGVHTNWIRREVPAHSHFPSNRLYWKGMTTKKDQRAYRLFRHEDDLMWYAINIESLRTTRGFEFAKEFVNERTLFVVDESTIIKNPKAQQTQSTIELGKEAGFRRILSGSPIVLSPLDIWSQALFLSPDALPYRSWTAFKAKYAVEVIKTLQNRSFRQIVGFRNMDQLREEVGSFSTRLLKKDCLDLPEKVYSTRLVEMTPEQKRAYNEMLHMQMTILDSMEVVTSRSVMGALNKLQQILCGFIVGEDQQVTDIPTNRFLALKSLIEDSDEKFIIWTHYRHSVQQIGKFLNDEFPQYSHGLYYGETSQSERDWIVDNFQDEKSNLRFIVANAAASKGLTLTKGTTNVYFTNTYNLETRLQSEDRTHRIGTVKSVTYVDLVTPNSVDEKILEALRAKVELGNMVISTQWRSLFQQEIE